MKVLLAVSGGIDSMCMADMYGRAGGDYAVAHCNFHLRGSDSDADAEFVEKWAEMHGVPFFRADFDTSGYASEHGISIEMAARELRYAWFARIAVQYGFDAVAVAHNANDNAETLILNLLRGTGLRGLRGMASSSPIPVDCVREICATLGNIRGGDPLPAMGGAEHSEAISRTQSTGKEVRLIRPMLGMTRAEIEEYAKANGVEYREDRTNAENDAHRNRLRNNVFPEFARINPSFVKTLNSDMRYFAQADDIAEEYFREARAKILSEDGTIRVDKLLGFKHWKYVFFRLAEPCGFSGKTLDSILALIEERAQGRGTFAGKRFHSSTHVLETSHDAITFRGRVSEDDGPDEVTVTGPGDYRFKGRTVRIETVVPGSLKQAEGLLICDASALPFPFILRGWQAGDWMRPFGMGGRAKKLSDIFTDRKMSLSDKESAIVVYSPALDDGGDGRVAAVAGLRMDEALRVAKGSVKVLRISVL
jgi:tRNA(Ile)-lysidine synthase